MDAHAQNPRPDLAPAAHAVARLIDGVRDDQLAAPTPCPKYSVRELVGHIAGLTGAFTAAAHKNFGPATGTDPGSVTPVLPEDWRTGLPGRLTALAEAWRAPQAWDGDTQAGGVTFPAAIAGVVALNELVVHGWDLARATGQEYDPGAAGLEVAYGFFAANRDSTLRAPAFGPVVEVPEDAPLLDRVVGLSGRDPGWAA
ncbi:TIGR03086 family metal-binding protein [Streptomyces sp. CBMA152]|uniref:TIGR03086 family metal-binding protein n=1 Tax=Streptomyces sp. CBMA152 TaxID=1896312 RepID=UPI001660820E|nr:TIGR03086 family metal-binding protein [Streptomyces sp. CBMA152]MBD0748021.1 TIGR03086 family protein [Streptomyces sp. CBMA152]